MVLGKASSFYFVRYEQNERSLTVRLAFQSLCTTVWLCAVSRRALRIGFVSCCFLFYSNFNHGYFVSYRSYFTCKFVFHVCLQGVFIEVKIDFFSCIPKMPIIILRFYLNFGYWLLNKLFEFFWYFNVT